MINSIRHHEIQKRFNLTSLHLHETNVISSISFSGEKVLLTDILTLNLTNVISSISF